MLSKHETEHCAKILRFLDSKSIISLKDTITKGMVVVTNEQEALNVILECSNTVVELLSRKKLKREVLFKYLLQEKVTANPSGSKEVLIQTVLDYIKRTDQNSSVSLQPPSSTTYVEGSTTSKVSIQSTASNVYHDRVASSIAESDQQISREFIEWFYPMLNSLSGKAASPTHTWSAENFWPECRLRCKMPNTEQSSSDGFTFEAHDGCENCAKRLASFVTDLGLVFNANDTPNGYRGRINEHGMAKIAVCGTIHKCTLASAYEICGVFEQLFGLLRDPLDNNRWKIKFTDLSIQLPTVSNPSHSHQCLSDTATNEIMQN